MNIDRLAKIATRRELSYFREDVAALGGAIDDAVRGRRVLVVGGAGSIGSATLKQIVPFSPKALHVTDINENGLAELVRELRGGELLASIPDFRALPMDFGSEIFHRFLSDEESYDFVLNFAALKHVRSEKDVYSALQMIDTNVVKQVRLIKWLTERQPCPAYFSVSTDKAANPVNLMGASKRLMEHVIFSAGIRCRVTTARFANVAFSDGSLLYSWVQRLGKMQPIPVPVSTKRYFISPEEAGQICLIAAFLGRDRQILVPSFNAQEHLIDLEDVARDFLVANGFTPRDYRDEREAIRGVAGDVAQGHYPLLLTPLDTSGEKPYEEFQGAGEEIADIGMRGLKGIGYAHDSFATVRRCVDFFADRIASAELGVSKEEIVERIGGCLPEFLHRETGKKLDDRL